MVVLCGLSIDVHESVCFVGLSETHEVPVGECSHGDTTPIRKPPTVMIKKLAGDPGAANQLDWKGMR